MSGNVLEELIVFTYANVLLSLVALSEIAPIIQQSQRYATAHNFIGHPIPGYEKPGILLTAEAAEALLRVQERVERDGYCLVVYDGFRPLSAVDYFVKWAYDGGDESQKRWYYPFLPSKRDMVEKGYIARKSAHCRGSTVDLTLIKKGGELHPPTPHDVVLNDGRHITVLDDGTVDMGTSFDFLDVASHPKSRLISPQAQKMRAYLRSVMEEEGFKISRVEWWHFVMIREPFPAESFDYSVK